MNIGKTYSLRGLAASCPCRNNYSVQEKKTTIQAFTLRKSANVTSLYKLAPLILTDSIF